MSENTPDYPKTLAEVLNDEMKYRESTIKILEAFRDIKPWSGTISERIEKFYFLHNNLCKAYGRGVNLFIRPTVMSNSSSGNSHYHGEFDTIILTGKLSVITYLHEFAHAIRGPSERAAVEWSANLFKRIFPKRFDQLVANGHFMTSE